MTDQEIRKYLGIDDPRFAGRKLKPEILAAMKDTPAPRDRDDASQIAAFTAFLSAGVGPHDGLFVPVAK